MRQHGHQVFDLEMNLYHRQFTRNQGIDPDILADAAFLQANFVDFFGTWLQQDQNAAIESLDGLLSAFWSRQQIKKCARCGC